jgi:hypothetical protein
VASTSAIQIPSTSSGGKTKGSARQGSGICRKASTLIAATASTERAITARRDRIVAATVTGAKIRMANGFCRPPVRYSSTPSWRMS